MSRLAGKGLLSRSRSGQGRLVAQGTHTRLLADGGLYAQLYHRQFRTQHQDGALTAARSG